jgi:hypothetical protein
VPSSLKLFVPYCMRINADKAAAELVFFPIFELRWHSEDSSWVCHVMLVPGKTYMLSCHEIFAPLDEDVILKTLVRNVSCCAVSAAEPWFCSSQVPSIMFYLFCVSCM